jgi:hypothetical protein
MTANTFFFWLVAAISVLGVVSGRLEPWAIVLPCGMLATLFIVTPLRIRSKQWKPAHPIFEPIDFESDVSVGGAALLRASRRVTAELAPQGFVTRGHFRWANHFPAAAGFVGLLENPQTKETARLIVAQSARRTDVVLAFFTRFDDGSEVATTNHRRPSGLPGAAWRTGLWLPEIRDARALYEVHKQVVDRLGIAKKRALNPGDAATVLRDSTSREQARFAQAGYYYLDEDGERYWFTCKGAFLVAWRLTWPINVLYRAGRRRQTRKLLRELGINLRAAREPREMVLGD